METPCPQCHHSIRIVQLVESIPLFGKIMLQSLSCGHCGLKWSDVMSLEFREPIGFEVRITVESDLNTKLVRNSSGTVEIPELGVTIEPGSFAEGFFTNMEGLLERVEGILKMLAGEGVGEHSMAARERMVELEKCRSGKMPFTVRVLDPLGGSALIGEKVKRFSLTPEEVSRLKRGVSIA